MTQTQAKEMVLRFLADERYRQQEWLQASKSFVNRGGASSVSQDDGNARFLWGPWEINATARRAKLICLWPGGSWGYELNADVQREGDHFVLAQVRITEIRGLHRD